MSEDPSTNEPARPLRVLVVDDDPAILRMLSLWLRGAGYQVEQAADGEEAKACILRECPDLLITDWEMPRVDGPQLCQWLREQHLPSYVYTIFLTGHKQDEHLAAAWEAGADDYILKPVVRETLLARMRAGTRVVELESRLKHLAKCDLLTGLFSQRAFYEQLEKEWRRATRHRIPMSCVMLDLDYFKRINDTLGHVAGDEVLRQVSRILVEGCRASDVVCRYGGEEFCVLLPETCEANAYIWADRIRQRIAELPVTALGKTFYVTASMGVSQRYDDTPDPEALVDQADQALLVAKQSGRDRTIDYLTLTQFSQVESHGRADPYSSPLAGVQARHVMTGIAAGLKRDCSIGSAAKYLLELRINSAPVVDDAGNLIGILSEKDVMAIMLDPNSRDTRVGQAMKSNVVCYDELTPARTIYEFLCRVSIRGVIITCGKRPTGVISRCSLLRWFTNSLTFEQGEDLPQASVSQHPEEVFRAMLQMARHLSDQAMRLERDLTARSDDLVPKLLGGASRLQETVNDLLLHARNSLEMTECNHSSKGDRATLTEVTGIAGLLAANEIWGTSGS